jgi:hypothetical protein
MQHRKIKNLRWKTRKLLNVSDIFLANGTLRGFSCLRQAPSAALSESKLKKGERSVLADEN